MQTAHPADEVSRRMQVAREIALAAGDITLRYFLNEFERETKSDGSVVTVADRESELFMRGRIRQAFPEDGVLGEEFGEQPGSSGFRWILDPIDGTLSFSQGVPLFGVLVGVEEQVSGTCPAGVVHMPALAETVWAQKGRGCTWERRAGASTISKPARVSAVDSLAGAVLLSTDFWKLGDERSKAALGRLAERTRVQRTWADCYGYLLVATGRADIMLDPVMKVWDAAPLQPVLEEAGGTFTDWSGRATIHGGCGVATNGKVLSAVLDLLRE